MFSLSAVFFAKVLFFVFALILLIPQNLDSTSNSSFASLATTSLSLNKIHPSPRLQCIWDLVNPGNSTLSVTEEEFSQILSRETSKCEVSDEPPSISLFACTQECADTIRNEFIKMNEAVSDPSAIFKLLKQIFNEDFVTALRQKNTQLIGKRIFLPKIFPIHVGYNKERFRFHKNMLSFIITPNILEMLEKFHQQDLDMYVFSIEGAKGIGKSFMLYFLVCYMLSSDNYSVCFLPNPKRRRNMNHADLSRFFFFYYQDILCDVLAKYSNIDFCNFFELESNSLDTADGKRKFYYIIDQFNDLYSSYLSGYNDNFYADIFETTMNPRLIISGSSNNEYDWDDSYTERRLKANNRMYFSPHIQDDVAVKIIHACFYQFGVNTSSFDPFCLEYITENILMITCAVPYYIFEVVEILFNNLIRLSCPNASDGIIVLDRRKIDREIETYLGFLETKIGSELNSFLDKHQNERNANCINLAKVAVIYGTPVAKSLIVYDKKHFYIQPVDLNSRYETRIDSASRKVYVKAIHRHAENFLISTSTVTFDAIQSSLDSVINLPWIDFVVAGKLFELKYSVYSRESKTITLTEHLTIPLNSVVPFEYLPSIDLTENTLFIPLLSNYPMYDFILIVGDEKSSAKINEIESSCSSPQKRCVVSDSEKMPVRVFFIQFTITESVNSKLNEINAKFFNFFRAYDRVSRSDTVHSRYENLNNSQESPKEFNIKDAISTVITWMKGLSMIKTDRQVIFYESLIHYNNEEVFDENFFSYSFKRNKTGDKTKEELIRDLVLFMGRADVP